MQYWVLYIYEETVAALEAKIFQPTKPLRWCIKWEVLKQIHTEVIAQQVSCNGTHIQCQYLGNKA